MAMAMPAFSTSFTIMKKPSTLRAVAVASSEPCHLEACSSQCHTTDARISRSVLTTTRYSTTQRLSEWMKALESLRTSVQEAEDGF